MPASWCFIWHVATFAGCNLRPQAADKNMRAAIRVLWPSQTPSPVLAWLCVSVVLCFRCFAADSPTLPRDQDLVFHITDFGINQPWNHSWKTGDSFSEQHNRVFPELNSRPGAQILIQMPEDSELDRLGEKHWADLIASTLIDKVRAARANGTTEFEIQIVENMRGGAYTLSTQQERVAGFANSAYSAIGSLIAQEKATTHSIKVDVTAGSNGTQGFTQSTESWKPYRDYIQTVTLVDGRAFYEPTRQTILALGAEKVRISNTYGDIPAHDFSIAKLETTQRLKREFPTLTALLLEPLDLSKRVFGRATEPVAPLSSHVLVMTTPDAQFRVRTVYSDKTEPFGSVVARYPAREVLSSPSFWTSYRSTSESNVRAVPFSAPDLKPQKDPPLPYREETKKYLAPKTQTHIDPRQPPPPPSPAINRPDNLGGISFKPRGIRIILDETNPPPARETENIKP